MSEQQMPDAPKDAGSEAAKQQPRQADPPAGGGQGTADSARGIHLRFAELRRRIDRLQAEGGEVDPEEIAELTDILVDLRDDRKQAFLAQEALRELQPRKDRLTDKQLALALDTTPFRLREWRKADWYKTNIERVRREWRRKLELLPIFHPLGIALELQAVVNDPKYLHRRPPQGPADGRDDPA